VKKRLHILAGEKKDFVYHTLGKKMSLNRRRKKGNQTIGEECAGGRKKTGPPPNLISVL